MHADTALRQRQRDPARADAELERCAVAGESGEKVDRRADDVGLEHVGGRVVVPSRHALAEVIVGHGGTLPKRKLAAAPVRLRRMLRIFRVGFGGMGAAILSGAEVAVAQSVEPLVRLRKMLRISRMGLGEWGRLSCRAPRWR